MDVDIGPSSPAMGFALSGFPQAFQTPRVQLPANPTTATIPAPSTIRHLSPYPRPSSSSNSDVSFSNHEVPQNQPNLDAGGGTRKMRKRKAESQENERLSKRLSLLNLEQNGQKLYVPVESPQLRPTESATLTQIPENDVMQLDNSKHKVYIYDLDAELSSDESDGDSRLVFLPDIEKHLRQNRIPPSVLANNDGELAGMQMVLYSEPTSLTVPKEQDSVRKAIIEARQRVREKQKEERSEQTTHSSSDPATSSGTASSAPNGLNGFAGYNTIVESPDPDAMEVD